MSTETFETINVGDRVRSYDFPGIHEDCYQEGVVLRIGRFPEHGFRDCDRYEIKVDRIVSEGENIAVPKDHIVYPPVNGTPTLRNLTGGTFGVKKITP